MIQRIQTLYLVAGAALVGAAPFAGRLDAQPAASLDWFVPVMGLTTGLAFVTGLAAIFLYGNRRRQRWVVLLAQLFAVLIVGAGFAGRRMAADGGGAGWMLLALPAAAYVAFWLARRAIERDIELVRSMDRLR